MIKNYFITAWRNLFNNKTFTVLNILGLAIGVAVCLTIWVWLKLEISFDNFHPNGNRIFRLTNTFKSESESFSQAGSASGLGVQLPRQLPSIGSACRIFDNDSKLKNEGLQFFEPKGKIVDSNFFSFFGFILKNGMPDQVLNSLDRIVLTERLAVKYFGNQDPVGKIITVDGKYPMTVSGIAEDPPVNSHIQFDYLIPFAHLRKIANEQWQFDIDNIWVGGWPYTYVQLVDPQQQNQVEEQINQVIARFSEKEWKENKMSYQYHLQPLRDIHLKSNLRYDASNNGNIAQVNIFTIVGIMVLFLACINYINLTTAGAIKRSKETAIRKVVGALKEQLIGQHLLQTAIVCTLAVVIGSLLFLTVFPLFSHWVGTAYELEFSSTNLLVLQAFIVIISAIAGIYPAGVLSSSKPIYALKGNFFQTLQGNLIRKSLVVFQFTISIALISSILIISRQMQFIKNKSLGYNDEAILSLNYRGESQVNRHYEMIRHEFLENPYIHNISKHSGSIIDGLGNGWISTENLKGEEISSSLYRLSVDDNFLSTYNMKLVAGRFFSPSISTDSTKAVLVNEAAVRTFGWQKAENAIGKRFGKGAETRYVIGVIKDFNFETLHKPVEALLIGYALNGDRMSLKIDLDHTDEVIAHLRKTWSSTFPDIPLEYDFVDEAIAENYGKERKMQGIFYVLSALALFIACLGLFGLSMFVIERKVKEIGVRKVLGANVSGIVGLLSKDFIKLVLVAAIIASPLAWYFMTLWLRNFAYSINFSGWVFVLAGLSALGIALITVSFQAIKAALANPIKSLRTE